MKLIVGLGNPGKEYENTRHNIGFNFINFTTKKLDINFTTKFKSEYAEFKTLNSKLIFLKPQTFMNLSGTAVLEAMKFYKIQPEDIYVAFDDLDLLEGDFKIQRGKYPKIHNGVNDIINRLGTDQFFFIRVGIDGRSPIERKFLSGREYVLQKTNYDYSKVFEEIYERLEGLKLLSS